VLLGVAAVLLLAGACGLTDDDAPRPIAADEAPLDLEPTTVPVEAGSEGGDDEIALFFVDRSTGEPRLAPMQRAVTAVSASEAMRQLLLGPGPDNPAGYVSSIPPDTVLLGTSNANGTLTVNLGPAGGGLTTLQGQSLLEAFAQMVRTATGVSGVRDVMFTIDGAPISALTDAGVTNGPVGRDDYASVPPISATDDTDD
jgi:spore germination protein GerM